MSPWSAGLGFTGGGGARGRRKAQGERKGCASLSFFFLANRYVA
jgi:hypothetical protein